MATKRIDRPVAARIVMRLKDRAASAEGLDGLDVTLLEVRLIRRLMLRHD